MQENLTGYVKAIDYDREASRRAIMVTIALDQERGEVTLFLDVDQEQPRVKDLVRVSIAI